MKAIILAAGKGVRMQPLTLERPKPLVEIAGTPLLHRLVSEFPEEIKEIILVVGYLGHQIVEYCGEEFLGRKVRYVWQKELMGNYHALKLARPFLEPDERFAAFFPDDLLDKATIQNILKHDLAIISIEHPEPHRFGVITLNEDGTLKEIIEKPEDPQSNLVNATGYVLNTKIFDYEPPRHANGEYYLSVAIAQMAKDHKIIPVRANFWLPVGTPEDLRRAEEVLKQKQE